MPADMLDDIRWIHWMLCIDIDHWTEPEGPVKLLQQSGGHRLHAVSRVMGCPGGALAKTPRRFFRRAMTVDFELPSAQCAQACALIFTLRSEVRLQNDFRAPRRKRPQHLHRRSAQQTRQGGRGFHLRAQLRPQRVEQRFLDRVFRDERIAKDLRQRARQRALAARRRAADDQDRPLRFLPHWIHRLYFSVRSAPLPVSGIVASMARRCAFQVASVPSAASAFIDGPP